MNKIQKLLIVLLAVVSIGSIKCVPSDLDAYNKCTEACFKQHI